MLTILLLLVTGLGLGLGLRACCAASRQRVDDAILREAIARRNDVLCSITALRGNV